VEAHLSASEAAERLRAIKHIVVLMMENRSFDQMLGYLQRDGLEEVNGLTGEEWNADELGQRWPVRPCDLSEPLVKLYDPCHSAACVSEQLAGGNHGFVQNFMRKFIQEDGQLVPDFDPQYRDLVMRYYTGGFVPVYDALARAFCVCDAWHSSVPGDTWPNRLYALAGRHAKRAPPPILERIRAWFPVLRNTLGSVPIYEVEAFTRQLEQHQWRWYSHDPATLRMSDKRYRDFRSPIRRRKLQPGGLQLDNFTYFDRRRVSFVTEFLEQGFTARDSFLDDAARGQLRDVSWIDPNFFDAHVLDPDSNDDHPPTSVLSGQALVLEVYEALYKSRDWNDTILVVVYDEHGGFYDHVEPPPVDDDPKFKTLGVRVPAIVIGPRVPHQVCHTTFDHTSLLKTILTRFVPEEGGRRERALAAMPPRVRRAEHLGVVLGDGPRSDLPDPAELRPLVDVNLGLMRDARRAAHNQASRAPDGVGQPHEFHEFQDEFLRFARRMRDIGLPPGQP
jgi:phospholipase C